MRAVLFNEAWANEASAHFGSWAAAFPASAAAAGRVFAPVAVSVAGDVALAAVFSLHRRSVAPSPGDPAPASAGVFGDPAPAWQLASPVVAGISDPASGCQCLEQQGVRGLEVR